MHTEIKKSGEKLSHSAVAIGNFDGLHIAHKSIISECKKYAVNENILSAVLSFEVHTDNVLNCNLSPKSIISLGDKAEILSDMGIDVLYLEDFEKIKDMSPEEFCKKILIDTLGAKKVFCGFNFTFGKGAAGNADTLSNILSEYGVEVFVSDEYISGGKTVSSTAIRELIEKGEVEEAANLLTREYFIRTIPENTKFNGTGFLFECEIPENAVKPKNGYYEVLIFSASGKSMGIANIIDRKIGVLMYNALPSFGGEIKLGFEKYIGEEL